MYDSDSYDPQYEAAMRMRRQMAEAGIDPDLGIKKADYFYFSGNALSLQSRLDSISDQEVGILVDAKIIISGVEVKEVNMTALMCTLIWGAIILFPLFFICCNWWKKCVGGISDVPLAIYQKLERIVRGPNMKNLTLIVNDNYFGAEKANVLYNVLSSSGLKGFTFINNAQALDYDHN